MKTFAAILFLLTANAFAIEPVIERTEDLGHGFRFVTLAESSNSKFESVGHFQYLFYKDTKLARSGKCAVSKDGKIVIYQDGPSGNILTYQPSNQTTVQLTKKFPGLVNEFVWKKDVGEFEATIYGHPALKFSPKIQAEQPAEGKTPKTTQPPH